MLLLQANAKVNVASSEVSRLQQIWKVIHSNGQITMCHFDFLVANMISTWNLYHPISSVGYTFFFKFTLGGFKIRGLHFFFGGGVKWIVCLLEVSVF